MAAASRHRIPFVLAAALACVFVFSCGGDDDCHTHACGTGGINLVRHCHDRSDGNHTHPNICDRAEESATPTPSDFEEDVMSGLDTVREARIDD